MSATIVYLLILVFSEPGAAKPAVNITVMRNELACEQSRVAVLKGAAYPILVAQCAPLDLAKANAIAEGRR